MLGLLLTQKSLQADLCLKRIYNNVYQHQQTKKILKLTQQPQATIFKDEVVARALTMTLTQVDPFFEAIRFLYDPTQIDIPAYLNEFDWTQVADQISCIEDIKTEIHSDNNIAVTSQPSYNKTTQLIQNSTNSNPKITILNKDLDKAELKANQARIFEKLKRKADALQIAVQNNKMNSIKLNKIKQNYICQETVILLSHQLPHDLLNRFINQFYPQSKNFLNRPQYCFNFDNDKQFNNNSKPNLTSISKLTAPSQQQSKTLSKSKPKPKKETQPLPKSQQTLTALFAKKTQTQSM